MDDNWNKLRMVTSILGILIIVYVFGFLTYAYLDSKNVQETPEYKHWQMEQGGYNYCPYCGEELKEVKINE